jgi:hypothetical protein
MPTRIGNSSHGFGYFRGRLCCVELLCSFTSTLAAEFGEVLADFRLAHLLASVNPCEGIAQGLFLMFHLGWNMMFYLLCNMMLHPRWKLRKY